METRVVAPLAVVLAIVLAATFSRQVPAARLSPSHSHPIPPVQAAGAAASARTVAAANAFLATLDERQRVRAQIPLTGASRSNWSNLPTGARLQSGATERNGVKLGELSPAQRDAALALVAAPLSTSGYQKVMSIVAADQVLEDRTAPTRGRSTVRFGRGEYHVAILGMPSPVGRWMIQFGGHHLAVNVTLAAGGSVLTPSHTGAQPAVYMLNGQTIRPLGRENDKAFALINALDPATRKKAVLPYHVGTTVLGPGHDGRAIQPEGVRLSAFSAVERGMVLALVREWVGILSDDVSASKMAQVESYLDDTYFAWSGPTTNGASAYFRIQGPTLMIEYAPQSSIDHIHTFYRDPTNDYGERLVP